MSDKDLTWKDVHLLVTGFIVGIGMTVEAVCVSTEHYWAGLIVAAMTFATAYGGIRQHKVAS